jgi:hypothetical protein
MTTERTESWSALRYLRAVLWSFFGIRRGARARDDLSTLRPLPLVITGLLLATAFGRLLWCIAEAASGQLGA